MWRTPNFVLFQHGRAYLLVTCLKALASLHFYGSFHFKKRVCCINFPLVNQQNIVGFFYGAEQGGICRAGMVIKLQHAHSYRLRMGIGRGLIMKVELLSLWGLLKLAYKKYMHSES